MQNKKKLTTHSYFVLIRKSIVELPQVFRCRHVVAYLHELNADLEIDFESGVDFRF